MNVFYVDKHPVRAAEQMCDKHIVKMPLEVAQICCTCIWIDLVLGFVPRALTKEETATLNEAKAPEKPLKPEERTVTPYLPMMYNHPCTIWARTTHENYRWLLLHFITLCEEYYFRYGK